jgi:coenzyme F420-dependent glucose-6-phosphate dehydrogenase
VSIRIGYKASAEQFGPRDLVEYAVRAEELGLDSVTVSDHFLPWRHNGGHAPFALAWMAAVGERTERVLIGTSVLTPTFRYNPAVIAQAFATMGVLYPDRVMLGVGTGEALNEIAVSGREWPEFKERFARLREAVDLIRDLWTKEGVSSDGPFYRTVDASIYDRPDTPLKIYVAAGGPLVAKYAGRVGDGFIATSGKGMDLYTEKLIPAVKEGAEKAGKKFEDVDRMLEVKLSYDRDPALALENTRFWAPLSLTPEQKHSVESAIEMERLADQLPIEQVANRWIVASDPEEVLKQLRPYVEAGFNHLVVHGPGHDQERFLTQFTSDVVPLIRKLG